MKIIGVPNQKIILFDELPPEAAAMALAMYSRDPQSITVHLDKVKQVGPERFMATYYVGYGHKSIGDCGSTTICAELVSMLNAKAIQQNPLYNGQEASTRYLDMMEVGVLNPLNTPEGERIQAIWMELYANTLQILVPYLTEKYPMLAEDKPSIYQKAIKAKAFDIARGFLPAGCLTFVGWHTNLRQAWDHLRDLSFHPLQEVRGTAKEILSNLSDRYPSSFSFKTTKEQYDYMEMCSKYVYENLKLSTEFSYSHTNIKIDEKMVRLLLDRPPKTELPDWFNRYGQIQFRFLLDFGSFRDIQRHRSCTQIMPLLTTYHGFNNWYIDQLPDNLVDMVLKTIKVQQEAVDKIQDIYIRQYYIAMGFNVACELTAGLPSALYIAELRSGQTVHPTLRNIAQKMGKSLKEIIPFMQIHCDMGADEWTTARGRHDIVKKE